MENRCRYTRINGARCTMPTLNGHDLCYQHEERKRLAHLHVKVLPEPNAAGPLVSFCYPEDHASILANLHAIAEAFASHQIDDRQASMLNRLMQTCLKTLWQMNQFESELRAEEAIREVTYDDSGHPMAADPAPRSKTLRNLTACAEPEHPPRFQPFSQTKPTNRMPSNTCTKRPNQPHSFQTLAIFERGYFPRKLHNPRERRKSR